MPPVQRKPRSRTYDYALTRTAVLAQLGHLRAALAGLTAGQLTAPTRLGDWTVRELAAHLSMVVAGVNRGLECPAPPAGESVSVTNWVSATAALAAGIDEDTRELARSGEPDALLERAVARFTELSGSTSGDRLLAVRVGTMRLDDFLVTRCVELVVHTDDLAAAIGVAIPYDRQALATVTRLLADALAAKAPGGSVEVRVPPFAVVQCGEGPRHTRGTPPNVVETDPMTWLRLATGRTTWDAAITEGDVAASGERADLAAHLPLLG